MAKEVVWTKIILETFLDESGILDRIIVFLTIFFCKKFNIYNLKNVFFYNKNLFV